jgi:hypothetical protein
MYLVAGETTLARLESPRLSAQSRLKTKHRPSSMLARRILSNTRAAHLRDEIDRMVDKEGVRHAFGITVRFSGGWQKVLFAMGMRKLL